MKRKFWLTGRLRPFKMKRFGTVGKECLLNPISAGGGGGIHPPPGFSLAIATKINRSTPNFLTFNFYYRDIIWPENQVNNLSGGLVITLLSEALCFTTYLSLYFHRIFMFYLFFFWHLYSVLISVFWWKNMLLVIFLWIQQKILMTSAFSKRSEILMILVASAAQNLIVSLEIWLFSD